MRWAVACPICLGALLGACQPSDSDDIQRWMADVRRQHHPSPIQVPAISTTPEFRYQAHERPDPFDLGKLVAADVTSATDKVQPDLHRSREPLESFPIDSLRLIGYLRRGNEVVALIQADRLIYSARVGAYLGQDLGKITAIGEKTVDIDEWVADSTGRWVRRSTQLVLQEKK